MLAVGLLPRLAMHALTLTLDRARADWLAGDAGAWARYRSALRQVEALDKTQADRPRAERRPVRTRVRRARRA